MTVPESTRNLLKEKLWRQADALGWAMLSSVHKSRHYEAWTKDPEIGGRLGRYIDHRQIRVYIKDSLLRGFIRSQLAGCERPFRVLGISDSAVATKTYTKPHGRQLDDGRLICWGRADDWKSILMALHERTFDSLGVRPYAAIFLFSSGRFYDDDVRRLVADAARKLGIEVVVWLN